MADVIIEVLHGYRGVPTKNVYLPKGKHGVKPELAKYLVENGHAVYVDAPTPEPDETTDETPKRKIAKTKRKKSDVKE